MYTCINYLATSIYISRFVSNLTNINHDSAVLSQHQWKVSKTHNIFLIIFLYELLFYYFLIFLYEQILLRIN